MSASRRILGVFSVPEVMAMAIPILCVASLNISKKPLLGFVHLLGRDNGCSLARALDSEAQVERQNRIYDDIGKNARVELDKKANLVKWTTSWGVFWAPPATSVPFLIGEQKTRAYGDGPRRVQKGDVVLDCGANIGLYTLDALKRGAARVVAIEPALDNVECLHRNLASYVDAGRVVICPKGVWNKEDVLPLNVQPSNTASYSVALKYRGAAPGPYVQLTTIDELVRELKLERVDYIKMDIEGRPAPPKPEL